MTSQLIITLAILAFMIVMFVWQKFPMGVTTMTCCALLAAFGILSPSEAFGGFTNNSIILVAPMMALSSAITKTSIVPYIRNKVNSLSGKKGIVLILFFYLIVIAFVQFIPATATFSIMIVFLASLSNDGEVTPHPSAHADAGHQLCMEGLLAHRHGCHQLCDHQRHLRHHHHR